MKVIIGLWDILILSYKLPLTPHFLSTDPWSLGYVDPVSHASFFTTFLSVVAVNDTFAYIDPVL